LERFLGRLAINSAAILIACAGFCVAVVFLLIALYLGLAQMMEPWMAALFTALAAVIFALIVLLVGRLLSRHVIPAKDKQRHRSTAELGELFGRQAHTFLNANSPSLLGVLLAFGFAMGFSPKLRKLLMRLF
jgi:chromate transport protein ChrA